MDFEFEFIVEGVTREQAEALMEKIVDIAVEAGGTVAGGFVESEEDDGQEDS